MQILPTVTININKIPKSKKNKTDLDRLDQNLKFVLL